MKYSKSNAALLNTNEAAVELFGSKAIDDKQKVKRKYTQKVVRICKLFMEKQEGIPCLKLGKNYYIPAKAIEDLKSNLKRI
tara:strand:+ start:370 stop:612 length:243 start_codon:yes stop_codon:yes gene_type:complete